MLEFSGGFGAYVEGRSGNKPYGRGLANDRLAAESVAQDMAMKRGGIKLVTRAWSCIQEPLVPPVTVQDAKCDGVRFIYGQTIL